MALQVGVVLLLFDALRHGLLVARRQIAGNGLALFSGLGALQCYDFLHGIRAVERSEGTGPGRRATPKFPGGAGLAPALGERKHDAAPKERDLARARRDRDRDAVRGDAD